MLQVPVFVKVTKSKQSSVAGSHKAPGEEGGATRSVAWAGGVGDGPCWPPAGQDNPGALWCGPGRWPHLVRFWRMRGTMLEGGPALARNGCFSSSAAVALWAGSRTSRRSRKPFRDGDTCGGGRGGSRVPALGQGASPASSECGGHHHLGKAHQPGFGAGPEGQWRPQSLGARLLPSL